MIRSRSLAVFAPALFLAGGALSPAQAAAPECPGKTFDAFLAAFADDATVQRAHVADPLSWGKIDAAADPEPRMVTTTLPKAALSFPVMPLRDARQRDGLALSKTPKSGGAIEVLLAKPDTGYQMRYLFRPAGSCWDLSSMADESM